MIPYHKTLWAGTFSLFLAGCGGGNSSSGAGAPVSQVGKVHGVAHGGQSPITGSTITLYAVGSGGAATQIATTTTDSKGNFDFGSGITCSSTGLTATTLIYVTASGGNPGTGVDGVDNSAINMMAALGQCQNAGSTNINEITTVATAYALAGFTTSGATVKLAAGGTATGVDVEASTTNGIGLANAFAVAALLADPVTGQAPVGLSTTQPAAQTTVYSLANSLAACVNTSSDSSSQCTQLFSCALPNATFNNAGACTGGIGTQPVDVLEATLSVAHNPGLVSAIGIYDTATPTVEFSPDLTAVPSEWSVSLNFTAGGIQLPAGVAIDATGNAWIASKNGAVSKLSSTGLPATGSPFTSGVTDTGGIAIDASGHVWVTSDSTTNPGVAALDSSGTPLTGSPFTAGGLYGSEGVAIDASGHVWVVNDSNNNVSELDSAGAAVTGSPFAPGNLSAPQSLAIDGSGDVWVPNRNSNNVVELNSAGTQVSGSPRSAGGITTPVGIAIGASSNVWIANANNTLSELDASGAAVGGSPFSGGGMNFSNTKYPQALAIDALGNVWGATSNNNGISELDSTGAPRSGTVGFGASSNYWPNAVAIDASGNVWATNGKYVDGPSGSVTELVGAAAPTRTPLVTHIMPGGGFSP